MRIVAFTSIIVGLLTLCFGCGLIDGLTGGGAGNGGFGDSFSCEAVNALEDFEADCTDGVRDQVDCNVLDCLRAQGFCVPEQEAFGACVEEPHECTDLTGDGFGFCDEELATLLACRGEDCLGGPGSCNDNGDCADGDGPDCPDCFGVCNFNGTCEEAETENQCPSDCNVCNFDSSCFNEDLNCSDCLLGCDGDEICEDTDSLECSDCSGIECNRDGSCDTFFESPRCGDCSQACTGDDECGPPQVCSRLNELLCDSGDSQCDNRFPFSHGICRDRCDDSSACLPGTSCTPRDPNDPNGPGRVCERTRCDEAGECGSLLCIAPIEMVAELPGFCLQPCAPLSCTFDGVCDCVGAFSRCGLFHNQGEPTGFACTIPGPVGVDAGCSYDGDCVSGATCYFGSCRAFCNEPPECTGTCEPLGATGVSVCVP